jgi:hypothetical protein
MKYTIFMTRYWQGVGSLCIKRVIADSVMLAIAQAKKTVLDSEDVPSDVVVHFDMAFMFHIYPIETPEVLRVAAADT